VANQFLNHWWANLSETSDTDIFVKMEAIFRFDPGIEHFGGAGGAREWLGEAVISRESLTNY
jgi:hypothetical protein